MQAPSPLTLAAVESQFAEWRRSRSHRHTPVWLKAQAVKLLNEHCISQVCQRLGLNHGMLKRWRQELAAEAKPMDFVELGPGALKVLPEEEASKGLRLTLRHQKADGSTVSLSGMLSEAQWSWALKLLQETKS